MNWKAIGVIVLAPLAGSVSYAIQSALRWSKFTSNAEAFQTAAFLVPIAWLYGLVLTVIVGMPVGFAFAWILKRLNLETLGAYAVGGTVLAFCFAMVLGNSEEFWLPTTLTGLLVGLGYWQTVAAKGPAHV